MKKRTQVGIIGAGPSGLLLSQVLHLNGIESIIVERQSPEHILGRTRAGALEPGTVNFLRSAGVGKRLDRECHSHKGIEVCFQNSRFRLDLEELAGDNITIYGQTDITKDLMSARAELGGEVIYNVANTSIHDLNTDSPLIRYTKGEERSEIKCDFIAGCDGFRGVSRESLTEKISKNFEYKYPYHWLAILCESRPVCDELLYIHHEKGFVLCSMRSPSISRYAVQCGVHDTVEDWSEDRIWGEISERLPREVATTLDTGSCVDKSIVPLKSFVTEPMNYKRLFLAGDSAHIVPPTGAKGLNLACSDVYLLSKALVQYYKSGKPDLLESYSNNALERIWKAEWFAGWWTEILHIDPNHNLYKRREQIEHLKKLSRSHGAQMALAESYLGKSY